MIIADKIVSLRKRAGWSQEELAEKLGVTRQSVSKWEGAQSVPDMDKVVSMSRLFGVTTDYLLKDELEEDAPCAAAEDNDPPLRRVTMEQASAYLALRKAAAPKTAEKSVTFTVRADAGKSVYLAGSFNQWNPAGKKMLDKKNEGVYTATVKLAPGRYEYKFVIDGVWCADPENLDFVQNDHGTLNSVIAVA